MTPTDRFHEYARMEVNYIETELKDWFLQRQFAMERNRAMKTTFDQHNFTGLSMANASVPDANKVLWSDLTKGRPELEDSLSTNAKQFKADMYTKMFQDSTDLDHPCRLEGSSYLRCVQEHLKDPQQKRSRTCMLTFNAFDVCRSGLYSQQERAVDHALIKQDISDKRAKALFERRAMVLDQQTCCQIE
eukprot:CAMPEP_0194488378 /NCGR_PEP_ID=MMETSP0253-20130528/8322_1 /TAXON_ID=2966 /ORGANISM="Noctiluca scintillans" /LENGTH=188 /DNA_ID=CAMNT_0039328731 /DNA_START=91 /DNA_END=657 /DNA_ORIENTATION=-